MAGGEARERRGKVRGREGEGQRDWFRTPKNPGGSPPLAGAQRLLCFSYLGFANGLNR